MEKKTRKYELTNDVLFQNVFGKVGNERITKSLLEEILGIEIEDLTLDTNKRLIGDEIDDKIGRIDVKAKLNDGTKVIIEMQVATYENIEERILYYWSKTYTSDLKRGKTYKQLKKTIAILFYVGKLETTKRAKEYHTKWNIREEKHPELIFSEQLEIHIIELSKFDKTQENTKEGDWIRLIKEGEIDMSRKDLDEVIREASEELEKITGDPEIQEKYLEREMELRDRLSLIEDGYERGKKAGMKARRRKGKS